MTKLSISRAWDETAAILKRDGGTLYLIAFGLCALPQVLMQAVLPAPSPDVSRSLVSLLLFLASLAIGTIGTLAITSLALGRETVVGRSLKLGARRFLSLLGATVLLLAALLVVSAILTALFGLTPENAFTADNQPTPRASAMVLLVLFIALLIGTRFLLTTPVAAGEEGGSFAILRRSWALTAGNYWRLLGFLLLIGVAALAFTMAVTVVSGILIAAIAGPPAPGSPGALTALLIASAANALFVVCFSVLMARIYAQLSGNAAGVAGSPPAPPTTGI